MIRVLVLFSLLATLVSGDVFTKGKTNLNFLVGSGDTYNRSYGIVGVGAEYCVVDNLAVGVNYRAWLGAEPTFNELSLRTDYYISLDRKLRPYLGAFVKETFINSSVYDDFTSYGFRGGLSVITSKNTYISFGYTVEYYDTCEPSEQCYRKYPELTVGLSF
ncbi:hypothetical protein [Sulfurimonas marina]|uniref:Outer membrane protein beta-barrel domain-containing protein n=1 Tax=Sulfurimonas marina TaxID=2590551 RepID=A0A7M1AX32_9BACT|nr:hypothetical protein [Sulfurimonas marina]QOP42019.1 hypothetical protein FJR03_09835 [Sulfurimonas marina]